MKWLPIMPSRGVNLFDDPRSLGRDECLRAKNLVPTRAGVLEKRGGLDRPLRMISSSGNHVTAAMISPVPGSTADVVVFERGLTVAGVFPGQMAGYPFASTATNYVTPLPFDHPRPYMVAWHGSVYLLPGPYAEWTGDGLSIGTTGPSRYPFYVYNLTGERAATVATGLAFQGVGNGNVFPSIAVPYKQRLVLMNFGGVYRNTIVFTNNHTADVVGDDVLASNGRSIDLAAVDDGDEIIAGIEVMLTGVGSPAESGLLILRKHGEPYLLTGDMDQTSGGTSTLNIMRISIQTGCASPYTVARTPVGIVWAGSDDVWAFAEGTIPRRLGQKIQPALQLTPNQLKYRWTGVYFDGFYRLAIWGEGQPMDHFSAPGDQWWLDLSDGLPPTWKDAEWWGPQQFKGGASAGVAPIPQTWNMLVDARTGKDPKLYYVDRVETSVGVKSSVIGEYGKTSRDMTATAAYIADKDYVDPEVTVELVTPEFQLQPPYLQVNDGIAFAAHSSSNVRLSTDFVLDNGEYKYTTTKSLTAEGFLTGSGRLNSNKLYKKTQAASFYPSNRRAAMQHRFRIYETAGWVIVPTYNDCLVVVMIDNVSGIDYQWIPTIAQGAYSSTDLVTAVIAAINAAKLFGNNWSATYAAGVPTFVGGGPYASSVTQQIKFVGTSAPTQGTTSTQAQLDACRRLMAIMGFLTSGTNLNSTGLNPSIAGVTAPFKKGASRLEMHSLQAQFEVIPREP